MNGLIRQYFPKGADFRHVTDAELRKVVNKLNDRPRKRLGYRIPAQVFLGNTQELWIPQVCAYCLKSGLTAALASSHPSETYTSGLIEELRALPKGTDEDKPRNMAKSVTVE